MQTADPQKLERIYASITAQMARGMEIDQESWLRDFPESRSELARFFQFLNRFGDVAIQVEEPLPDLKLDADQLERLRQVVWEQSEADFGLATDIEIVSETLDEDLSARIQPSLASSLATDQESYRNVGPYKLVRKLADGGMGTVWLAQQFDPVERQVAIKLIRSELRDERFVLRFHAERRALALMTHPNIAQIYSADATPEGSPYFVMEYVDGKPIHDFCLEQKLSLEDRLKLFLDVCQAVEHAHRKGVLHRDLKPSNVLVTMSHGQPMVKVVDFGIAKLLDSDIDDSSASHESSSQWKTYTELGQVVGTLAYMSPEQAASKSQDIDTRSDVYSLGALLYQLMTGDTPIRFEKDEPIVQAIQRVQIEIPESPSRRLLQLIAKGSDTLPIPSSLIRSTVHELRNDVDWIVMKAINKERDQRYLGVEALSQDIRRYLAQEPVMARGASSSYVAKKWIKKHRLIVSACCAVCCVLVLGLMGTTFGMRAAQANLSRALASEAKSSQQAKNMQRVVAFQSEQLGSIKIDRMAKSLEELVSKKPVNVANTIDISRNLLKECLFEPFAENAANRFEDQPELAFEVLFSLATNQIELGLYDSAKKAAQSAFEIATKHFGKADRRTGLAMRELGYATMLSGNPRDAEANIQGAVKLLGRTLGEEHADTLAAKTNLAGFFLESGRLVQAQELFYKVYETEKRTLGEEHPQTLHSLDSLASTLHAQHLWVEAEAIHRKALKLQTQSLGEDHQDAIVSKNNLAYVLKKQGKTNEASQLELEALESVRRTLGDEHPTTLLLMNNRAMTLVEQGLLDEAQKQLERILELRRKTLGDSHSDSLISLNNLANLHNRRKDFVLAKKFQLEAVEKSTAALGLEHPTTLQFVANLCQYLKLLGETDQLEELLQRIAALTKSETISLVSLTEVNNILQLFPPRNPPDK